MTTKTLLSTVFACAPCSAALQPARKTPINLGTSLPIIREQTSDVGNAVRTGRRPTHLCLDQQERRQSTAPKVNVDTVDYGYPGAAARSRSTRNGRAPTRLRPILGWGTADTEEPSTGFPGGRQDTGYIGPPTPLRFFRIRPGQGGKAKPAPYNFFLRPELFPTQLRGMLTWAAR